ncbi:MAG: SpoIID/LytB domain-containing protein [bacterium]|nr:SpoIID/LytB domain-containing protein [bacterium]
MKVSVGIGVAANYRHRSTKQKQNSSTKVKKQKQNRIWDICYSRGVVGHSDGPYYSRHQSGVTVTEKALRVFGFMIAAFLSAQILNGAQNYLLQDRGVLAYFESNIVRERISLGYVGSYFPPNPDGQIGEYPETAEGDDASTVLSANTHRARIAAAAEGLAASVTVPDYRAELVSQNYKTINIAPGRAFTFEARFRNTGRADWTKQGPHYIGVNVTDPAGRHSPFWHPFWSEYYYRSGRLVETKVAPGEVGTFRFALQAPAKEGSYRESFHLVAEHLTWISGGKMSLEIQVLPRYQAEIISQTDSLTVSPGAVAKVTVEARNTGAEAWSNSGENFIALNVTAPTGRHSKFQHASWDEYYYRPTRLETSRVSSGQTGAFEFTIQAPLQSGSYTESFGIVAENAAWLPGGNVTIPITVTQTDASVRAGEPSVRVGLYQAESQVQLTGLDNFRLIDGGGEIVAEYASGVPVTISFSATSFEVNADGVRQSLTGPIRFEAIDDATVFELLNYENRPEWNLALNDNMFRGVIEIRQVDDSDQVWVINELPLEQYLLGVAESSNENPTEFLKALAVAERSYVLYHLANGGKHQDEGFTVDAKYDQVYRGYNFELRAPAVGKNVLTTAGQAVAYEDEVVVTPYFSHSDGRTRSWEEVWSGGPYPWLETVADPASAGKQMSGHGVGMSALGARSMAEDGALYEDILAYYYSGTVLLAVY